MAVKGRSKYSTQKQRKFGGKVYQRTYHFALKGQANEYAKSLKRQGFMVRVVGHIGVYTVYKR